MRALGAFLLLIVIALAAMALFTYPLWSALYPHFGFPFHRVADRIGMVAAAVGLFVLARRLRLTNRAMWGFGVRPAIFVRELAIGWCLGAVLMGLGVLIMVALQLLAWKPGMTVDAHTLAGIALTGVMRGIGVALIEEIFIRGAMYGALARESGWRFAIGVTSFIYALTHFIGRTHIAAADAHWGSGLDLLAGSFQMLAHPADILDAFACLYAVGVVLGAVRRVTGHIGACIGLHAAFVCVITFVRETSLPNPSSHYSFLLSRFDGVVGWLLFGWTLIAGALLYLYYSHRRSAAAA